MEWFTYDKHVVILKTIKVELMNLEFSNHFLQNFCGRFIEVSSVDNLFICHFVGGIRIKFLCPLFFKVP